MFSDDYKREANNEQIVAQMRDAVLETLPMLKHVAKLNYQYYKSLLDSGFNEAQALELVKVHGTNFRGN